MCAVCVMCHVVATVIERVPEPRQYNCRPPGGLDRDTQMAVCVLVPFYVQASAYGFVCYCVAVYMYVCVQSLKWRYMKKRICLD